MRGVGDVGRSILKIDVDAGYAGLGCGFISFVEWQRQGQYEQVMHICTMLHLVALMPVTS